MIQRLYPGYVEKDLFWFIIDISVIRSDKMINALHDHLVEGYTRSEVCDRYNVNPGYLSVKIKEINILYEKIITFLRNRKNAL
ncbi:transcriptional regulator [Escherichia coli]|nr:PapB/FocB family fimbrial expression transcriptional regulator [Escherichia coli]EFN8543074.1 transcriptional regulator [Escherichia coli O117]KAE9862252.1 transcriptional regulator [Escherichia coli]MCR6167242.1 adhesin biosynthesis transcription regulatory family protein [Escherichia coli]MEB7651738.1 adhesin biosynthesis transcription regulatory family protein [Escherichia coli]MWS16282.1 transcriptional regulator [Escherichia coli]